jgi:tetratricopeptide (TPR) repeat protein
MVLPMTRACLLVALLPALATAQPAVRPDGTQQPGGVPGNGAAAKDLPALLADLDATYERRDDAAQLALHRKRLAEAQKLAPKDYEVLWRAARLHFWLADDPKLPSDDKSRLGKAGWELGDRATQANPGRVEGWHFAAAGVGNYALGIGVFTALRQGIEGKFKERLSRAEKIDPKFQNGAIQTAWGRFWYELPWPKYSERRSRESLEAALRMNPDNVRARVYLAELHLKESRRDAAAAELQKAISKAPGRYDAPEERRWQEVARRLIAELRTDVRGSEGG